MGSRGGAGPAQQACSYVPHRSLAPPLMKDWVHRTVPASGAFLPGRQPLCMSRAWSA